MRPEVCAKMIEHTALELKRACDELDRAERLRHEITDRDRIQWLIDRVDYLEHRDANGVGANFQEHGGYWPQRSDHDDPSRADQDMIDLDLVEYIDAQITKERA